LISNASRTPADAVGGPLFDPIGVAFSEGITVFSPFGTQVYYLLDSGSGKFLPTTSECAPGL
jgi:hypothetical protein